MKKTVPILSFALAILSLFSVSLYASNIVEQHDIKVRVDQQIKKLDIRLSTTINKISAPQLHLVLNESAANLSITSNGEALNFQFDRENKPNHYFDGGLLTIASKNLSEGSVINFNYTLDISSINYWTTENLSKGFTSLNGFEIGMYTAWLPTELSNGNFNYSLTIQVPDGYKLLGNGAILHQGSNQWRLTSNSRLFDIPIIVSNRIETVLFETGANTIEINHFGKSTQELSQLNTDIEAILTLFNDYFGQSIQSGTIRFAFVPRDDVASYSRKGFIAINTSGSDIAKFSTLAHEIGHFWWTGSDSSLWEDWLNESFAEFSALTAIKQKYGEVAFKKRLKSYDKVSQNSPAVWGIDRTSDIATLLLYRKGPVILENTRLRLGDEKFKMLLRTLVSLDDKSTENFLNKLALLTSVNERAWLEQQLRGK